MSELEQIAEIIREAVMRGSPAAASEAIARVQEIVRAMSGSSV